ncbi:hypothetical protein QFC19_003047 [Naganishia cerealis]|uniref:Uncharacterized protein n=1 Tax=Naganishia cerealis TaxID=610337 RepID=A0ACC2W4R6_9TREE|nr:hypothetical protein QFC19_003047 [Naganishia cerealis]
MAAYFKDMEIGGHPSGSKATEKVNQQHPVRPGNVGEPGSSTGIARRGIGGTRGNASAGHIGQTGGRPPTIRPSLPARSNDSQSGPADLYSPNNPQVLAALYGPTRGISSPAGGRGGRSGYRGKSTIHGRRLALAAGGTGPRESRDEDYQPNLEAGVANDAPPEIKSVSAPLPRPASGWGGQIDNRRGGYMHNSRGHSMHTGRGRPRHHPPHPSSNFSGKRKRNEEDREAAQGRPIPKMSKKEKAQKRAARVIAQREEAQKASISEQTPARNADRSEAPSGSSSRPRGEASYDSAKNARGKQASSESDFPGGRPNARNLASFNDTDTERRDRNSETHDNWSLPAPDSIPASTGVGVVLEDTVTAAPVTAPHVEREVSSSLQTTLRSQSVPQKLDKGKGVMHDPPEVNKTPYSRTRIQSEDIQLRNQPVNSRKDTVANDENHVIVRGMSNGLEGRASSNRDVASTSMLSRPALSQAGDISRISDRNEIDAVHEKEESHIDEDVEVLDVDGVERLSGTICFPMPNNCSTKVKDPDERRRNRLQFIRQQQISLENNCRVMGKTLWRSDGLALDWVLNRNAGTYRAYWPKTTINRVDWVNEQIRRCREQDSGREVTGVTELPEVCEIKWRKVKVPTRVPSLTASTPVMLDRLNLGPSLQTNTNPDPVSSQTAAARTSPIPSVAMQIQETLTKKRSVTAPDEKEDHNMDDDIINITAAGEQKSGSQAFPMPPDCNPMYVMDAEDRRWNRRQFVRKQKIQLENDCKRVTRTLWRDDGCALDWELDREKGTYREFWPGGVVDYEWAKCVAERCRVQEPGRVILSIAQQPDIVEINWKRVGTNPSANPIAKPKFPPTEPENGVNMPKWKAIPNEGLGSSAALEIPGKVNEAPTRGIYEESADMDMGLQLTSSPPLLATSPTVPAANGPLSHLHSTPQLSSSHKQAISHPPDVHIQSAAVAQTSSTTPGESQSVAQQETSDVQTELTNIETEVNANFGKYQHWYHIREKATGSTQKAIAQDRMDRIAERIEELMARQTTLQNLSPAATSQ